MDTLKFGAEVKVLGDRASLIAELHYAIERVVKPQQVVRFRVLPDDVDIKALSEQNETKS